VPRQGAPLSSPRAAGDRRRPVGLGVRAVVVAALLVPLLLVPEHPRAQGEICERHHGVQACQVW
jgi:hypothetical protein